MTGGKTPHVAGAPVSPPFLTYMFTAMEEIKTKAARYEREIPAGYEARIEGNKVIIEQKESEDERIRKELIYWLKGFIGEEEGCGYTEDEIRERIAYLERQKGPLTPEEKMNHPLYLEGFDVGKKVGEVVTKPAEWSEEDREMKRKILKYLSNSCNVFEYEEIENWLNNLRPQPHWKPSKEQMEALNSIILNGSFTYVGQVQDLISLKDELKQRM